MAFSTYSQWRVALQQLLSGDDDVSQGYFSVDVLDMLVVMAESRVNRELRASTMLTALSVAVSSNAAALPADCLELKEVYFSGDRPLEIVRLDKLRELIADATSAGTSYYAAQDGDTLVFWPSATGTVIGKYWAKPAALSAGLHTTFQRYPEVYTYATLVEAAPQLRDDARIPLWEQKYQQALNDAMHVERMKAYGGSPLRIRAR
jgi:hypothetical protein